MIGSRKVVPVAFIAFFSLFAFATIFVFMPFNFNPDSAFYLILAREQLRSGLLFPPGMCYSTELFVVTPGLFMIPLFAVLDNWMLIRSLGICATWIILLYSVVKVFVMRSDEHWLPAVLSVALLCTPFFGSELVDKLFLQGAYLTYCITIAVFLGLAHYICVNEAKLNGKEGTSLNNKKLMLLFGGIALVLVVPNLGGIRNILQASIPFILSFFVLHLLNGGTLDTYLANRFNRMLVVLWIVGTLVALGLYRMLSNMYWASSEQMTMTLGDARAMVEGIGSYITDYLLLYGQGLVTPLISAGGILKSLNCGYAVLSIFVFPIYGLLHLNKFENTFYRYLIVFAWISNLLLMYVSVATGAASLEPRYIIPAYFLNVLVDAACLEEILARRTALELRVVVSFVMVFALLSTGFFWRRTLPRMKDDHTHQDIVEFLESRELDFGYASFFNSYVNTCFSNGDVEILSFAYHADESSKDPTNVWRWLTNEKWYDPTYHPGRCFILLRGDERVDNKWYSLAKETLTFEDYTILVFDKNINYY